MTTEKQNEANRSNAKQSTGPRTDEGKQRSAQNALKHGLRAKQTLIPGEDPVEFDAVVTWFENTFNPSGAYEASLVRQMADAEWRLRRIGHLEKAYLSSAVENRLAHLRKYFPDEPEPDKVKLLGDIMQTRTANMSHFSRYEVHQDSRFHRCFKQLIEFRELNARDRRRNQEAVSSENEDNQRQRPMPIQGHNRPPRREEHFAERTRYGVTQDKPTTSDPPTPATSGESSS